MPYVQQMFADIRALVLSTVGEVRAGGIWEATYANRIPWEKYKTPYCVILAEEFPRFGETLGADLVAYNPTFEIYFVDVVNGPCWSIVENLESMRDCFIDKPPLSNQAYIEQIGDFSWGPHLRPNMEFARSNKDALAGMISIRIVVGQIAS